jgi:hypothetical protein
MRLYISTINRQVLLPSMGLYTGTVQNRPTMSENDFETQSGVGAATV